jgi:hypothetical protein
VEAAKVVVGYFENSPKDPPDPLFSLKEFFYSSQKWLSSIGKCKKDMMIILRKI